MDEKPRYVPIVDIFELSIHLSVLAKYCLLSLWEILKANNIFDLDARTIIYTFGPADASMYVVWLLSSAQTVHKKRICICW